MNDIFTAKFKFPRVVNILAPGPNGREHWGRCLDYTIAVNRAVLCERLWPHMWLIADKICLEKEWWVHTAAYRGARMVSDKVFLALSQKLTYGTPECDLTFRYERLGKHCTPIPKTNYVPMPGRFQGDGTSTGIAIEAAARFGAEKIILCGVDYAGETHWDGYESLCTITDRRGDWSCFLPYMNSLVNWVRRQGVEIYSYSPTSIDVEQI